MNKKHKSSEYDRIKRIELRLDVMSKYSCGIPKCACCGETHYEFLSIDHIEGCAKEYKDKNIRNSKSLYRWLKKNDYPQGFRVLCMNCNSCIGTYGYCQHKKQEAALKATS